MYKLACAPIEDSEQSARMQMQADQSLMGALWVAKDSSCGKLTLIILCGSADRFESSLYAQANLYLMLDTISIILLSGRFPFL